LYSIRVNLEIADDPIPLPLFDTATTLTQCQCATHCQHCNTHCHAHFNTHCHAHCNTHCHAHCHCLTLRHTLPHTATHCHCHCHAATATATLPPTRRPASTGVTTPCSSACRHCHCHPCHTATVTPATATPATLSLPHCHCHCHTVILPLPNCHMFYIRQPLHCSFALFFFFFFFPTFFSNKNARDESAFFIAKLRFLLSGPLKKTAPPFEKKGARVEI
jgi:hypothetical protein